MRETVSTDTIAEILREMARHESEQIHRRVSWLGMFQGFLFAALGFSWGKNRSLELVIALVGLMVAVLVFSGLLAATFAIERIRKQWHDAKPEGYRGPDIMGFYPDRLRLSVYTSPKNLLPLVFAAAWTWILFIR